MRGKTQSMATRPVFYGDTIKAQQSLRYISERMRGTCGFLDGASVLSHFISCHAYFFFNYFYAVSAIEVLRTLCSKRTFLCCIILRLSVKFLEGAIQSLWRTIKKSCSDPFTLCNGCLLPGEGNSLFMANKPFYEFYSQIPEGGDTIPKYTLK